MIFMKTIKFFIFLLSLSITLACNKEYTCTCRDDQSGEITNVSIYDLSERDARSACKNADSAVGLSCVLDEK